MEGLIQGKVAVITGAGSGVGRAATLLFGQHGAKVIAADIDSAAAEESAALAGKVGCQARAVACNVTDESSVIAAVKAAVETYGRLDIIYNNAGITASIGSGGKLRTILETPLSDIERITAVNLRSESVV